MAGHEVPTAPSSQFWELLMACSWYLFAKFRNTSLSNEASSVVNPMNFKRIANSFPCRNKSGYVSVLLN